MGFLWLGGRGDRGKWELGLGFEGKEGIEGCCGSKCGIKAMFCCPRGYGLLL